MIALVGAVVELSCVASEDVTRARGPAHDFTGAIEPDPPVASEMDEPPLVTRPALTR